MRDIAVIVSLFLLVQFLGLYTGVALVLSTPADVYPLSNPIGQGSGSILNAVFFVAAVMLGAVFFLLLFKFYRGNMLFRLLEFFIILAASEVVFEIILINLNVSYAFIPALILAFGLAVAKFVKPSFKNVAAVVSSAGVGALFGFSLNLVPAIAFLLLLGVYDVLSVFWTGHMITMAREFGKRGLSFSVSAETKVKVKKPGMKKPVEEKATLELGTGDMSIPLMLAVAAFKQGCMLGFTCVDVNRGVFLALGVVAGSTIALAAVLYYVSTRRAFLPALPPIALGGLVGLLVASILSP